MEKVAYPGNDCPTDSHGNHFFNEISMVNQIESLGKVRKDNRSHIGNVSVLMGFFPEYLAFLVYLFMVINVYTVSKTTFITINLAVGAGLEKQR